jgi:hypothetical protein
MSELQELCGASSVLPPMELGSSEALAVAMTSLPLVSKPCQALAIVDNGGLDASGTSAVASGHAVSSGHVVSLSDGVDEVGVLAPNSEALFGKEICDLLVSLEMASPGFGKEIVCVLAGKASKEVIKKVEKSL